MKLKLQILTLATLLSANAFAQLKVDVLPTVSYKVEQAGPNGESLQITTVAIPGDQEKEFVRDLIAHQKQALNDESKQNQLLIVQTPEDAKTDLVPVDSESANVTVRTLGSEYSQLLATKDRVPADQLGTIRKAGYYVAIAGLGGTMATFFLTQKVGPAIAGSMISVAFQYLMNVKPKALWHFLNAGGNLAVKLTAAKNFPKAERLVHEAGKTAAGILFNIALTSAFTTALNYPTLTTKFPTLMDFMAFVVPTAVTSFFSKNTWDLAIARWTTDAERPVSEKTALLVNYTKMTFLSSMLPLMYVPSLRADAMTVLTVFGAIGIPAIFYGKPYINLAEYVIAGIENSRAFKAILEFAHHTKKVGGEIKSSIIRSGAGSCTKVYR